MEKNFPINFDRFAWTKSLLIFLIENGVVAFFSLSINCIAYLEDLSNEVIYGIFDFLDFCQLYEAFSNLNRRFKNLLDDPTLSVNMKLSSVLKSTFQHYYSKIIIPNQHRAKLLHLSNPFIINLSFFISFQHIKIYSTWKSCFSQHQINVSIFLGYRLYRHNSK